MPDFVIQLEGKIGFVAEISFGKGYWSSLYFAKQATRRKYVCELFHS
jgi:hypothetical protein